jgi:hypothetical protein
LFEVYKLALKFFVNTSTLLSINFSLISVDSAYFYWKQTQPSSTFSFDSGCQVKGKEEPVLYSVG